MRIYDYCTNNHPSDHIPIIEALIDEHLEVDLVMFVIGHTAFM